VSADAEIKPKSKRGGYRPGAGRKPKALSQSSAALTNFAAYEGAEPHASRGYIYFPTLNPAHELTPLKREALMKKARWLTNNQGFALRAVDGIARYCVGTGIIPQARTANTEFNRAAERRFEDTVCSEPGAFDRAGQVNFYEAQALVLRQVITDGDFFGQFMKSRDDQAMMRFVGAESVGNASWMAMGTDQAQWLDGVRLDPFGRPIAYRVLNDDKRVSRDVPASDMLHFRKIRRNGQVRGVTWMAHAVNKLQDMTEVLQYVQHSHKLFAQIGFIVTSGEATATDFGARLASIRSATTSSEAPANNLTPDRLFDTASGIMNLKPGEKIEAFSNPHPGPTMEPFLNYLARDISWGMGLSPEVLWSIAGIGGANTRHVLQDAATFFAEVQDMLVTQFCRRFWLYWLWHEMRAGRLPYPGDDWWRVSWIRPARPTVDFGRDTKAILEIVRQGGMSIRTFAEMHGLDEELEEDAAIETAKRRMEKCAAAGVPLATAFPEMAPPSPPMQSPDETDPPAGAPQAGAGAAQS
jgi:lambda family phage portal protein